jgi:hypothetical protein
MSTIITLKRWQDEDFFHLRKSKSLHGVGLSNFYYSTLQHNKLAPLMIILQVHTLPSIIGEQRKRRPLLHH